MSDRYTVHSDADGARHIHDEGKRWSQSGYRPADPFDELVLQAVVDGLNGRAFKLTGTALAVAEQCGMPVAQLELHISLRSYALMMRLMREHDP